MNELGEIEKTVQKVVFSHWWPPNVKDKPGAAIQSLDEEVRSKLKRSKLEHYQDGLRFNPDFEKRRRVWNDGEAHYLVQLKVEDVYRLGEKLYSQNENGSFTGVERDFVDKDPTHVKILKENGETFYISLEEVSKIKKL